MQNTEQNNNSDFMMERIKQRPLNRRKLLRRTITTLSMAVIFGLVACVTFLLLEPVISNWLYPEEEPPVVTFPEEEVEMEPEEMLSESMAVQTPSPAPEPVQSPDPMAEGELMEEQMLEVLSTLTLDVQHYSQLYTALGNVVKELNKCMVTITARETNVDWLSNIYETSVETMGIVLENNEKELLILTNYSSVKDADRLDIVFENGIGVQAQLKRSHSASDLAILSIDTSALGNLFQDIPVAAFGSSNMSNTCVPVIALGCPMGDAGSVGYGMITSENGQMTMVDANYKLLTTDIYGSTKATGYLFNLKGQLVGVITGKATVSGMENMITAYGISDLKKLIANLSEGKSVAYMGITGIDVSETANTESQVPMGVYVTNLAMDSPAMLAGVQRGDIVVGLGNKVITRYNEYFSALSDLESGQNVKLRIMRQMQDGYKEMEFDIVLEEAK